jgi:hypothetical protein
VSEVSLDADSLGVVEPAIDQPGQQIPNVRVFDPGQ